MEIVNLSVSLRTLWMTNKPLYTPGTLCNTLLCGEERMSWKMLKDCVAHPFADVVLQGPANAICITETCNVLP